MENEGQGVIPVRTDLIIRDLTDEVVLYDRKTRRAHCLNPIASAVWKLCDGARNSCCKGRICRPIASQVWRRSPRLVASAAPVTRDSVVFAAATLHNLPSLRRSSSRIRS